VRATPFGAFLEVERRYPLEGRHGASALGEALAHRVPLRHPERGPCGRRDLAPSEVVFLDTETTGLAGGTGTVAFLVGLGWVEGAALRVRQYFLRDYPEEPALLWALREDLGDRPLVSFNGRSFDWPLLTTRFRLNRVSHAGRSASDLVPAPRAHLDLLPAARRLWARTLHSHSLGTLERHVLGLERGEDLPGWRIPAAWFDWLRDGDGRTLALAFRHNPIDVVSMLSLMGAAGAILDAPDRRVAAPGDRVGTARLLLDLGDLDGARRCLEAGVEEAPEPERQPLHALLGWMARRGGRYDEALRHFEAAARLAPGADVESHEQAAKILEHRHGDFEAALRWTREALARVPAGAPVAATLRHRAERLERRLAAREP
jgi:uncharacterized protein YprB with RNaseH-like and TPR domain